MIQSLFISWGEFFLSSQPNSTDNGVHGSASPLEGLREKENWLGKSILEDAFGRALAEQGLTKILLKEVYFNDPIVKLPGGTEKMSLFDAVEDLDAKECLDMLVAIYDTELKDAEQERDCSDCSCVLF